MKVQKVLHTPIHCPYCGRTVAAIPVGKKVANVDEEIKCGLCKRRFKFSDLPKNLAPH